MGKLARQVQAGGVSLLCHDLYENLLEYWTYLEPAIIVTSDPESLLRRVRVESRRLLEELNYEIGQRIEKTALASSAHLSMMKVAQLHLGLPMLAATAHDVYFIRPEELEGLKGKTYAIYITCPILDREKVVLRCLTEKGKVIIYNKAMQPILEK